MACKQETPKTRMRMFIFSCLDNNHSNSYSNPHMQSKLMAQELNGQRPQTPGDNAPSPSKRPRLENGSDFNGQANRQVSGPQQQMMQNGQVPPFGGPGAHAMKLEQSNGLPPNMANMNMGAGHDTGKSSLMSYSF
jgi:hypothetical protein